MTYPEGAAVPNTRGWLPLFLACKAHASLAVVRLLLESSPTGARAKLHDDSLALHIACLYRASEDIIQLLVGANPEAVYRINGNNETPLDLAYESGCSSSITEFLEESRKQILLR